MASYRAAFGGSTATGTYSKLCIYDYPTLFSVKDFLAKNTAADAQFNSSTNTFFNANGVARQDYCDGSAKSLAIATTAALITVSMI